MDTCQLGSFSAPRPRRLNSGVSTALVFNSPSDTSNLFSRLRSHASQLQACRCSASLGRPDIFSPPVPGASEQSEAGEEWGKKMGGREGGNSSLRLSDALFQELTCVKTAACCATYLFGGEFDQGSLVALERKNKEASEVCSRPQDIHEPTKTAAILGWTDPVALETVLNLGAGFLKLFTAGQTAKGSGRRNKRTGFWAFGFPWRGSRR